MEYVKVSNKTATANISEFIKSQNLGEKERELLEKYEQFSGETLITIITLMRHYKIPPCTIMSDIKRGKMEGARKILAKNVWAVPLSFAKVYAANWAKFRKKEKRKNKEEEVQENA